MRLDISFLVGVWLEALVYGVYLVAFIVCLRFIRTRAPSVGRALPVWLVALFVLATAHCALSLSALLDAFVRQTNPIHGAPPYPAPTAMPRPSSQPGAQPGPQPGPSVPQHFHDPTAYISNRALPTNLATLGVYAAIVLLSDLMLLYRLLVMYRYRFIWAVLPGILTIASFVVSMIVVSKYAHIDLSASYTTIEQELGLIDPWVPPVYAISFLANLSLTALMMVKTSFASKPTIKSLGQSLPAFATHRRHTRMTSVTAGDGYVFDIDERTGPVPNTGSSPAARTRSISSKWVMLAGIVEAGAITPVFMLAALILYVAQGGQESLIVPLLAPLAALVPTLQIIQIQLGLDSTASSRPNSYHTGASSTLNEQLGRSPYLVPAARYRDSFSSDEEDKDGEARFVGAPPRRSGSGSRSRSGSGSNGAQGGAGAGEEPVSPTSARRFSAQITRGMWAWRGRASGSGSGGAGSGTATHSHTRSISQSGSSGRAEPVHLQMRDLTGLGGRVVLDTKPTAQGDDGDVWERIKLDEPAPNPNPNPRTSDPAPVLPRRSTLRKNSVAKEMISKPVPVAADFPPTTATIPSTAIVPALPSFTLNNGQNLPIPNAGPHVQLKKTSSTSLKGESAEHKYHYRMRPREKTASPLAAYLSAQAVAQRESPLSQSHHPSQSQELHSSHQPGLAPPALSVGPPSSSGHGVLSLPSTTPTSPASGFTSLGPASAVRNPFRYDGFTQGQGQVLGQIQGQMGHKRSYSDVQRAAASGSGSGIEIAGGESGGMAGVGLAGVHRTPLTFPHHPQPQPYPHRQPYQHPHVQEIFTANPEADQIPRWAAPPGAPPIPGLDVFLPPGRSRFGGVMEVERDVSPAPGLQRDYARAREEVLRQMNRERGGGAMTDDESVYSAQVGGPGWRGFPGR
ncbi:hypothetical protein BDV93DRAFT_607962 [Ceratobasidium sp. AG-I]|nr:hypothetical protein BDV93DRAFT_607962 [Ceratobasidium sp. AG-I]